MGSHRPQNVTKHHKSRVCAWAGALSQGVAIPEASLVLGGWWEGMCSIALPCLGKDGSRSFFPCSGNENNPTHPNWVGEPLALWLIPCSLECRFSFNMARTNPSVYVCQWSCRARHTKLVEASKGNAPAGYRRSYVITRPWMSKSAQQSKCIKAKLSPLLFKESAYFYSL